MRHKDNFRSRQPVARSVLMVSVAACFGAFTVPAWAAPTLIWQTVVNNNDSVPDDGRSFNSYNQPSVNNAGLVAFRARSRGGQPGGEPATGVFTRDMAAPGTPINVLATRSTVAPVLQPLPNGASTTGATFNEFPAIPRIDRATNSVATRGQTQPTLIVPAPPLPGTTEPTTTRVGTAGVYATTNGLQAGSLQTGVTNIAQYPQLQVPGAAPGTKFDQFPGSPSITNGTKIVFKGNWADTNGGQTGVYWRDISNPANAVVRIADSNMLIPGTGTEFGSTAPPTAAKGQAVFLGVDNEDNPTVGGIYKAGLTLSPALQQIVAIGDAAPGFTGAGSNQFTRIGEALSFDGRYLAFWGGVGNATTTLGLQCASDGNASVLAYCQQNFNNFPAVVPTNQGIFLADTLSGSIDLVASTWGTDGFTDFLYWGFTGRPPGVGGGDEPPEDQELARWRSSSFVAVDNGRVAFKGSKGDDFGLYLHTGVDDPLSVIAQKGGDGGAIDPEAAGMTISALGIERDGFANGWLAITASMVGTPVEGSEEVPGMAGVYVTRVPEPTSLALLLAGAGAFVWRRRRT